MTEQKAKDFLETKLTSRFKPCREKLWLCPRCGTHLYLTDEAAAALSRRADVGICPPCGTEEAIEDYAGRRKSLSEWYAVRLAGKHPVYVDKNGEPVSAGMRLLSVSGRIRAVIGHEWEDGTPDLFFSSDGPLSAHCIKSQVQSDGVHRLVRWEVIPSGRAPQSAGDKERG